MRIVIGGRRALDLTGIALGLAVLLGGASASAQARAELSVDRVSGELDRGAALAAMRDTGNAVQRCLLLARAEPFSLAPRGFRVEVDAQGTGRVVDTGGNGEGAAPAEGPLDARVRGCMHAAIARVRYGGGRSGPSVLRVIVRLTPG